MFRKRLCLVLSLFMLVMSPVAVYADTATAGTTEESVNTEDTKDTGDTEDIGATEDTGYQINIDPVLKIATPAELDFTIDPLELSGRGQLYSNEFTIENYGENDVILTFEEIKYTFVNNTDFVSLKELPEKPFGLMNRSDYKELYMVIQYLNCDLPDFVITDEERLETRSIKLNAATYDEDGNFTGVSIGGSVAFQFSGIVNHMPAIEWNKGDVKVSITYTITDVVEDFAEEDLVEPGEIVELEPISFSETEVQPEPESASEFQSQIRNSAAEPDAQAESEDTANAEETAVPSEPEDTAEAVAPTQPDDSDS